MIKTTAHSPRQRPTSGVLTAAVLAAALAAGCSSDDDGSSGNEPGTGGPVPGGTGSGTPGTGTPGSGTPGTNTPGTSTPGTGGPDGSAALGIPTAAGAEGYSGGVVTAANPLAAKAGIDVLAAGGNAVDAAIAVQFALNVVEPTSSGIGGGGFMGMYLPEEDRTLFIDSRERAPAAATPTQFLTCDPEACPDVADAEPLGDFTDIATSGIAVGVPGTLLGIERALADHGSGTFTLAELVAPAVALAADGFEINERLATLTADERTSFWPETRATFRTPAGEPLAAGFLLVQPDLAKTLRLIAERGVEAFYSGPVAQAIVDAQLRTRDIVGPQGAGRMTLADLDAYRLAGAVERDAIVSDYRGYTINGMPPPSSGGLTVAQILECVEQFPLGDAAAGFGRNTASTLNVMLESMRLAFSSRSVWMGDTDIVPLPTEGLLADGYLAPRCDLIKADARLADDAIEPGDPRPFDPGFGSTQDEAIRAGVDGAAGIDTTHFTVIDANGLVVTWTSTIEGTWGTGITVPGYGFLLNNELTDFNFFPQASDDAAAFAPGANDVAPLKRPRSSMAPTLVFDANGDFLAAYGSPGGSTIINTVVDTTIGLIDHGLSVQDAIDAPRISTSGGSVAYEDGFDAGVLETLRGLGHELADEPEDIGSVQAVVVDPATGLQYGGADDRRAGTVEGLPAPQ